MKSLLPGAAAVLCLPLCAVAQPLPAETALEVDRVFASYDRPDSPGCAMAVYRNGSIAYAHGYGLASLEHAVPIAPSTVFDLGSTSKQFTGFSILLLERDGKLSIEDDVRKYVTELPDYGTPIRIRHLLTHTSGLRDYLTLWDLAGQKTENWTTQEQAVALAARQKALNFSPGDEYLYSNTGYLLLAEIVRRVSGKSLKEFAADRIFAPLGMTHTFFLDDHKRVVPHRAVGYMPRRDDGFEVEMSNYEQIGDGAVQSTVEDLLLWDRNFYEPKVGDAALVAKAQAVGRLNNGEALTYAAGLTVRSYRGLPVVRHGGSWAGYRAELLRFPSEHTSIACLCNLGSSNPGRLAEGVADVVLRAKLEPQAPKTATSGRASAAPTVPEALLRTIEGIYEHAANGSFQRLVLTGGALRLRSASGPELAPAAPGRFLLPGGFVEIAFPEAAADAPREMRMTTEGEKPEVYRRLPAFSAASLADYAGPFYSEELDATWTLRVKDGALSAQIGSDPPIALAAAKADVFLSPSGTVLRFGRAGGRVQSIRVDAGRVKNLEFRRSGW